MRYGTGPQKERWLQPLLDGTIRSCFAMTEPQVTHPERPLLEPVSTACAPGIQNGLLPVLGLKFLDSFRHMCSL